MKSSDSLSAESRQGTCKTNLCMLTCSILLLAVYVFYGSIMVDVLVVIILVAWSNSLMDGGLPQTLATTSISGRSRSAQVTNLPAIRQDVIDLSPRASRSTSTVFNAAKNSYNV